MGGVTSLAVTCSSSGSFWETTPSNNIGRKVIEIEDGGFVILIQGEPIFGGPSFIVHLVKLDVDGTQLWDQTICTGNVAGITETSDGGFILTGSVKILVGTSGGFLDLPLYRSEAWLARRDSYGNPVWEQTYIQNIDRSQRGVQVTEVFDGAGDPDGYVVIGSVSPPGGSSVIWIMKTGDFQGSCRTNRLTHQAATVAAFSFAGLSFTVSTLVQFLVFPDHRSGCRARACS